MNVINFKKIKEKLSLKEAKKLLKEKLKDTKYGKMTFKKAQKKMEEETKEMKYPVKDE